MSSAPGGTWTAGSLYKHQVGMPAFFKGSCNAFFQGTTNVKITGLGHILEEAGYNSTYLVGNAEFAGMSDILKAYGIPVISKNTAQGPRPHWDFYDYDLFQEARLQINRLRNDREKPFALFMSTINSHFPDGIYDQRMERFVSKRESDLEFSVSAVDYLIGHFVSYLKVENLLQDTAVFIFPDHILMGRGGVVHGKLEKSERSLYLITNVGESSFRKNVSDTLYQIDLPRMIIDGAGIKTNAKFLVDFIPTDKVIDFLEKNRIKLTTLNSASVSRKDYKNGIDISVVGNFIRIGTDIDSIELPVNGGRTNVIYDITFNSEMVLIKHNRASSVNAFSPGELDIAHKRLHLLVETKNGTIGNIYLGNKQAIGIHKDGEKAKYTKEEIFSIIESNTATSDTPKASGDIEQLGRKDSIEANVYRKDDRRFIAHAGGRIDGHNYTNSLEAMNLSFENGFRLFELDIIKTSDDVYVAAHDWKHWAKITQYKGNLPPSRKIFLQQKIYGKYTPLDIVGINAWFSNHPDAILVTDKVNAPIDFSNKFLYRKRLMMELFTWDAVKKGVAAGIGSAMPTGNILSQLEGNKIIYLKKLGITDIVVSRRIINTQKTLLEKMADSGINIFAFHINFDNGKNERYVVCNEREYFYGIYADEWDFNASLDCTEQ
jgi:hypothetical protein